MITLTGSITTIKARISASGDTVQTLQIEFFGDFAELQKFLNKPVRIAIEEDKGD